MEETDGTEKALSFSAFFSLNSRLKLFSHSNTVKFVPEYPPSTLFLCQFVGKSEGIISELEWRFAEIGKNAEKEVNWLRKTVQSGEEMEAVWMSYSLLDALTREMLGNKRLAQVFPKTVESLEAAARRVM